MVRLTFMKIIECLFAFFIPPFAVFLQRGFGVDLFINIVLCLLFYIPGIIHAFYVVFEGRPATQKDLMKIVECVCAFFLPPLAVFLQRGCGIDLLINVVLCILFFIPGIIHAFYIVLEVGQPAGPKGPGVNHSHYVSLV